MNAYRGVLGWAMNQEWHVWKIKHGGFATNTMSTTWSCKEQYYNDETCHNKRNGGKLHGNISRNGYGNAIIGRYGGCFEEDIRRFMCDRVYHITGFGCTGKVCTTSRGEKGPCTVSKRLANYGKLRVRIIHGLNISHKELIYLLQKSTSHQKPSTTRMLLGG